MPVKKTVAKKSATKKPATKAASSAKVVEVKKPTVVVETKKTDRCECGDSCNCCCKCGCVRKIVILLLIVANLIVSLLAYFKKNPWDLTVLSLWWEANREKVVKELYEDEDYISLQKEQIEASLPQYLEN